MKKTLGGLITALCLTLLPFDVKAEGPAVSGFIDTTYNYNFNSYEETANNLFHSYDAQANTFLLNTTHLVFNGSVEQLSYVVELDVGSDASVNTASGSGEGDDFDIQEAYGVYSVEEGMGLKFGKFVTYNGIEVIESGSNPTISRGYLFGLAEPFTHVGGVFFKTFGSVDIHIGAVNGWDQLKDVNTEPTGVLKVGYNGGDPLNLIFSAYAGPEQADNNNDKRVTFDLTGVTKIIPSLDLWFQLNTGSEDNVPMTSVLSDGSSAVSTKDADWSGLGIQPIYHVNDDFSVGFRYEYFKDDDGVRTGSLIDDLKLHTVSVCPSFAANKNLVFRLEARLDKANEDVFEEDSDEITDTQTIVYAQAIYSFA